MYTRHDGIKWYKRPSLKDRGHYSTGGHMNIQGKQQQHDREQRLQTQQMNFGDSDGQLIMRWNEMEGDYANKK